MSYFNGKDEPENGFTVEDLDAEVQQKLAILRALIADFIDEKDREPLSSGAQKVASRTPLAYLEAGAELCEAAPEIRDLPPRGEYLLRITPAGEKAFMSLLETAEELVLRIREAMARKRLTAIPMARLIHRIARLIVASGMGQRLEPYVDRMNAIICRGKPKKTK